MDRKHECFCDLLKFSNGSISGENPNLQLDPNESVPMLTWRCCSDGAPSGLNKNQNFESNPDASRKILITQCLNCRQENLNTAYFQIDVANAPIKAIPVPVNAAGVTRDEHHESVNQREEEETREPIKTPERSAIEHTS